MIPRNIVVMIVIMLLAVGGMGIYGYHLHRQALELRKPLADAKPAAPPVSGPAERVTLFIPDDEDGALLRRDITVALPPEPTLRARGILHALIAAWQERSSTHPIGNEADVKEVFLLDNNHTAIVDVNGAFAEQHRSGILVEELTLVSIARTLGANMQGLERVKVIIDGQERETLAGHADLTDFYPTNVEWKVE